MQVPALIQKHSQLLRIVSLKVICRVVVFPLNTFSIFTAVFSFAFSFFAYYCVVLYNAPLGDRDKNVSTMGYFFRKILIYRH